ncbi:MAG: hypothetical protein GXX85_01005 [Ignavibacteria bacterium]|nr:hypothetical protein [Ignavibacteria bacterium]
MSINELKSIIHKMVDNSQNEFLLEAVYNIFYSITDESVWQNLTDKQKELILKAFEESERESNLIDHSTVMMQIQNEL